MFTSRLAAKTSRLFGFVAATALALTVPAPATAAESSSFNPFAVNNGFGFLAATDATLSNGELEGSIAVFGTITAGKTNFAVIHEAAGQGNYTVPLIDGTPVRILAESLGSKTGQYYDWQSGGMKTGIIDSGFAITDRDDSNRISASSNEANAIAKFVDTNNLRAGERGGFTRLTNTDAQPHEVLVDLEDLKWSNAENQWKTEQGSVEAYFSDYEAGVSKVDSCFADLQDNEGVNTPKVSVDGGIATLSNLSNSQPNYIKYEDIAGKIIKGASNFVPTVQSPIVIQVPAGTSSIGPVNFEGWSASKSAQQGYSQYIVFDASKVEGTLKLERLEMGALWAPHADVVYDASVTTNGQWTTKSLTALENGGELHQHDFKGQLPCVVADEPEDEPSTEPSEAPSGVTDEPTTGPSEGNEESTGEPSEGTDTPSDKPASNIDEPAGGESQGIDKPAVDPQDPTDGPSESTDEPSDKPAGNIYEPAGGESQGIDKPAVDPQDPTDGPSESTDEPSDKPAGNIDEPTGGESQGIDKPAVDPQDPTDGPSESTDEPAVEPSDPSDEPSDEPSVDTEEPSTGSDGPVTGPSQELDEPSTGATDGTDGTDEPTGETANGSDGTTAGSSESNDPMDTDSGELNGTQGAGDSADDLGADKTVAVAGDSVEGSADSANDAAQAEDGLDKKLSETGFSGLSLAGGALVLLAAGAVLIRARMKAARN